MRESGECNGSDCGDDPRPGDNHAFLLYGSVAMARVCTSALTKQKTPGRGPGSCRSEILNGYMQRVIHHGRIRRAPPGREFDSTAPGSPTNEKPRAEARGLSDQVFRTALPALADFPDVSVEILADDAAMTTRITIVISVAAIAGSVTAVIVAPARANADADANRARAYPYALRIRRHRHRDTRRREKSDGKFLHKNLLVAVV